MNLALLLFLAILPGLLIVYGIYRLDLYEKESWSYLAIAFVLGIVCCYPAIKLEFWGMEAGFDESNGFGRFLVFVYIIVGLSEELMKYLALVFFAYPRKFFNEPIDGIIYSVMIGMGFAIFENILYANHFGIGTILVRAFTAVPAHAVFAIFMGFFIGKAKFNSATRIKNFILALVIPVLIHGTYDLFILQQYYEWLMVLGTFTVIISGYFAYQLIQLHQADSPFKKMDSTPVPVLADAPIADSRENEIMDAILKELGDEEE